LCEAVLLAGSGQAGEVAPHELSSLTLPAAIRKWRAA